MTTAEAATVNPGNSGNQLNPPQVDTKGQPTQRAITDPKQIYGIAKSIKDRALLQRLKTGALIARRYNADHPYPPQDLTRLGQTYRNNFSTNFLGSIIDRVVPQLIDPIKKAPLLVHSALCEDYADGAKKARKFNEVTTKTIRAWPEWGDFLNGLAQDVALYGNAAPARLSKDWRPVLFRYDETFIPEGTGQHATQVQVACFSHKILMHDFLKLIKNPAIAEKAGYDVEGCAKAANATVGTNQTSKQYTPIELEDALREQSPLGFSYGVDNQTKTVNVFYGLVHDYTGQVDLWMVDQNDGTLLQSVEGLHEKPQDAMTLFTMQTGNRKFYGSKGLGRLLHDISLAIERGRCTGMDKQQMSGLPIFKSADPAGFQLKLRFPYMTVPMETEAMAETIEFEWESFNQMDEKMVSIAESIAGAFIPPNVNQEASSKTKIEAAQKAERDMAIRQGVLERFANQATELCDMMKRAIYSPLNIREGFRAWQLNQAKKKEGKKLIKKSVWDWLIDAFGSILKGKSLEPEAEATAADPEAVSAVIELLDDGLTPEEIAELALASSLENNANEGGDKESQILGYLAANKGVNPYLDQQKLAEQEAIGNLGEDRARDLLIPTPDPNLAAEANRQQIMEMSEMLQGNAMQVSGRDNHALHRKTLAPQLDGIISAIAQNPDPKMVKTAQLAVAHYEAHLAADPILAAHPEQGQAEEEAMAKYSQVIKRAETALQVAAKLQAEHGLPGAVNGQPAAPNPEQATQDHQDTRDTLVAVGDHNLRKEEIALRHRELNLKEAQHAHAVAKDGLQLQQKNVDTVANAVKDSAHLTLEEKKLEAQQEMAAEAAKAAKAKPAAKST
jgi:hypothetical protein